MEISIKRAEMSDLEMLLKWRMEVLHEVFPISENQNMAALEQSNRLYYERTLQKESHIACFSCQGEEIIGCGGMCIYQEMPSPDNPSGYCAYLMNIYTRPQFRGQGIGEKMVKWLMDEASGRKITKVYLETSESGRKLYRKLGFLPMQDYMMLE